MKTKMIDRVLLDNGTIYDPFNDVKQEGSILIEKGYIKKIGKFKYKNDIFRLDCRGKILTPGFIDIHSHFREPGREDKETLLSGAMSAFSGGFTRVCVMPNTDPPLDKPEMIHFIKEKSKDLPIKIFPIGAITKKQEGREIAEIGKMVEAGAVAISDDGIPLQNGHLMRNAVEYASKFNIPVINHAEDVFLRNNGVINEGGFSTNLGLIGSPDISESVMVFRDLQIAEYTNGRIHIPHVSSKKSVKLIKEFKKRGLNVTAEVTPHHIGLNEENISNYNTNAKVAPPLRQNIDRFALIEGLIDGTIDCIASDHAPHTIEEKEQDFINAPCGMIGLESAFGISHTKLKNAGSTTEQIIQWMTKGPAQVMGWDLNPFEIGSFAEINIIDPLKKWTFNEDYIFSRSKNSPMLGMKFQGKVVSTISGLNSFGLDFNRS